MFSRNPRADYLQTWRAPKRFRATVIWNLAGALVSLGCLVASPIASAEIRMGAYRTAWVAFQTPPYDNAFIYDEVLVRNHICSPFHSYSSYRYSQFGDLFSKSVRCGSNGNYWDAGQIQQALLCPVGWGLTNSPNQWTVGYCVRGTLSAPEEKNLGDACYENCNGSNPIHTATGNKYQREVDYVGAGAFPLVFERHYNSRASGGPALNRLNVTGSFPSIGRDYIIISQDSYDFPTPLGAPIVPPPRSQVGSKWRHTYDRGLEVILSASFSNIVRAYRPSGRILTFTSLSSSGSPWTSESDVTDRLAQIVDGQGVLTGWTYTNDKDEVEIYDRNGRLLSIRDRRGLVQTLSYTGDLLASVTDDFGHSLQFGYDAAGRLNTLTLPSGQAIQYGYDPRHNLETVTYPGIARPRTYKYEDANWPLALTGIVDENNARYATWTYDPASGKATSSKHGVNADLVTLTYNANGTTTVTDAFGVQRVHTVSLIHGTYRTTTIGGSPCTGCGWAASTTYDGNGFLDSRTDHNGNLTDYTYNARGLQTTRTEAFGTPKARTITTQWHSTFRLPTQIDEPGRRTTFTYDSATGNLNRPDFSGGSTL